MMRAEHYREAERLLETSETLDVDEAMLWVAQAQVHAMLASCPIEAGHPGDYGVEQ